MLNLGPSCGFRWVVEMNPSGMKEEADVEAEGGRMDRGTFFFFN